MIGRLILSAIAFLAWSVASLVFSVPATPCGWSERTASIVGWVKAVTLRKRNVHLIQT